MTENLIWLFIFQTTSVFFVCVMTDGANRQECPTIVSGAWWECPPFVFTNVSTGTKIRGNMYRMLDKLVRTCCPSSRFQLKRKYLNGHDMEKNFTNETIVFPLTRSDFEVRSYQSDKFIFIPVLKSEGMFLLRPVGSDTNMLMRTLSSSWPLLLLIVGTTGLAGIFVWALDTFVNPSMFPRPFLQGFWEGFWCAYVTMATVGYGDRTPQSVAGRLFMFVWMITGIIMVAVFTASLTSSLTSQDTLKADLFGQRVRVLWGSRELLWASSNGVRVKEFKTLEKMYENEDSKGEAHGQDDGTTLLDSFVALHFSRHYRNKLARSVTIRHPVYHGFLFQGKFKECAVRYTMQNRFSALPGSKEIDPDHHKFDGQEASEKPYKLVRNYNTVNFIILGVFGSLFIIILSVDVLYRRSKHKRTADNVVHAEDTLKCSVFAAGCHQQGRNSTTKETVFAK